MGRDHDSQGKSIPGLVPSVWDLQLRLPARRRLDDALTQTGNQATVDACRRVGPSDALDTVGQVIQRMAVYLSHIGAAVERLVSPCGESVKLDDSDGGFMIGPVKG